MLCVTVFIPPVSRLHRRRRVVMNGRLERDRATGSQAAASDKGRKMLGNGNTLRVVRMAVVAFFLVSVLPAIAANQPTGQVTYETSVERVYQAEVQAFGAHPTSSVQEKCLVNYNSASGPYRLSWSATCKDIGNGKVSVTLAVQGQWFFGVADERKRIARIFWSNMNVLLKGGTASGGASAPASTPAPASASTPTPTPAPAPSPSPLASPKLPHLVSPSPSPLVSLPSPQPQPDVEASATVHFSSDPGGADIVIDGDYEGSTPSQIKLKPGKHSLRIIKKGFVPWERSINLETGQSGNIDAVLEKPAL
jgi:PEGA domain